MNQRKTSADLYNNKYAINSNNITPAMLYSGSSWVTNSVDASCNADLSDVIDPTPRYGARRAEEHFPHEARPTVAARLSVLAPFRRRRPIANTSRLRPRSDLGRRLGCSLVGSFFGHLRFHVATWTGRFRHFSTVLPCVFARMAGYFFAHTTTTTTTNIKIRVRRLWAKVGHCDHPENISSRPSGWVGTVLTKACPQVTH